MKIVPSFLLLACLSLPVAAQAPSSPTEAPYTFAMAKMLAEEGSYRQALETFEKAVELAPEDPYVRIEYAELLTQLASFTRLPGYRQEHLERAGQQVEEARRLAPADLDVLKVAAGTFLTIAQLDPQDPDVLSRARDIYEEIRRLEPREIQARMALAEIHSFQDRPDRAAEVYEEVVRTAPGNRRVYELLVDALLRSDQAERAEAALAELVKIDPEATESRVRLAELRGQRGDHAGAVEILRQAPTEMQADPDVRRFLAFQLYRAGDLESALVESDAVLAERPEVPLARLRAVILSSLGRIEEAVEQLRSLLSDDPDNTEVAASLGRLYARMGDSERAQGILEDLDRRLQKDDPERWYPVRFDLLDLLMDGGQWEAVEAQAAPLLAEGPPPVRLTAMLITAEALEQQGRSAEALELLESSEEWADNEGALAKRGEILLRMDRPEAGHQLLEKLAAQGSERAVVTAGSVYQSLERYDDAIALYTRHLDEHPESVDLLFLLGAAYERSDRYGEAVTAFRKLLAIDPDAHQALNYLGYMWAERAENLPEALDMITRAVAMEPDNGAYVDSLGWVYYQLGRYEEALRELRRAASLTGEDATVLEHLGDAYLALGQAEEARKVYLEALKLEDENAAELRRKLEPLKDGAGSSR
jgi:tetratricopeptide (TPR) repeat protein